MSTERFGRAENSFNNVNENIHLCDEWERQIGNYLKLGFPAVLGMSMQEYLSSIPNFQLPSVESKRHFSISLLIEPRISPRIQLMLAGYQYFINGQTIDNVKNKKNIPYMVRMQDGSEKNLHQTLAMDERGATIHEGVALLIAFPEVLKSHPVALPGSSVINTEIEERGERIPCIYKWSDGLAGIGADFMGYLEDDGAKPATCASTKNQFFTKQ